MCVMRSISVSCSLVPACSRESCPSFQRLIPTFIRSCGSVWAEGLRPLMVPPLWMMLPLLVARSLWLGGSGSTLCPEGWEWCLASSRGKECVHPRPISEDSRPLLCWCCCCWWWWWWWELLLFPIFKLVPRLYRRCHYKKGTSSSFSPETK